MSQARFAYLQRICQFVEQGKDIVIVSEDYAAPIFDDFRKKYPERFLSVGIAEQNGVAVACGLSLAGKYPIVYGSAPFPLTRAVDQIKSAVAGMHLPMTILNAGVGFSVPEFGATHYNVDDIAIVRGIPGMKIVTPTDEIMADRFAEYSINSKQPIYVRMDKNCCGELYQNQQLDFGRGFCVLKSHGQKDCAVVVSCGFMTHEILNIADEMETSGYYIKVIDLHSLPFHECSFLSEVSNLPIMTLEEHIVQGGIGTIVLELLNDHQYPNRIFRKGIHFKDAYPETSGQQDYFLKQFKLNRDDIKAALQAIAHQSGGTL